MKFILNLAVKLPTDEGRNEIKAEPREAAQPAIGQADADQLFVFILLDNLVLLPVCQVPVVPPDANTGD